MGKYIDSEKLIAGIDSILSACTKQTHTVVFNTCTHIKGLITTLQQEQPEANEVEKALSLQIQAYLTTASDELYAPGKPLYTEAHHKGIHECMLMWQKLHQYYFSTMQEQPVTKDTSSHLEHWLAFFGCPKENIEKCATQIAQGYGAIRYLEGVQHGAEAVNELAGQERPEGDLEEEIDAVWNPRFNLGWDEKSLLSINHSAFETIARHFAEWGAIHLNARKKD